MDKKDAKSAVLNYFLYGVHKELMGKHHAFEKCIHEAMEDYAKFETSNLMEQNERLNKAMLDSAHNLIQFVAVELRGEKLSDEDIESIIHDYVHPKKE